MKHLLVLPLIALVAAAPVWSAPVAMAPATGDGAVEATAAAAPALSASAADRALRALYEGTWAWQQEDQAQHADADRLQRVDPAAQQGRAAYYRKTLAALDRIRVADLSPEERINAAVFRQIVQSEVDDAAYRAYEMPFTSDSNFWADLLPATPLRSVAAYRALLGRMRDIPRHFDDQTANMRAGLARGFSVPRVTLAGRDASIAAYAQNDPDKNPFYRFFLAMPETLPAADRAALQAEARVVTVQAVAPAYGRLLTFFRTEYLPRARTTLAAEAMPDGRAYYQAQIRKYTTTAMSAEEIHRIGLADVARIEADMEATKKAAGFTGSLAEFRQMLRTDPRFYARTPDELMGVAAYVAKRMDGELKTMFGLLPRYRFTIRPVADAIAPFYTSGRGGLSACLMNTYDLPSRPLYQTPALTLHECVPGHSFQAALALEGKARPAFRRQVYFSGYGEGWGLYAEWLGTLAGIYRTPYEMFGRESYEMWRAARLVVDTGIHHYGWSRDRAIAYLTDKTALSRHEVEMEVDRYISWPGQALAYKLGERTIRRKRADAERALGARFDQRYFHDMILDLGSVPLPVLESEIDRWIAAGGPDTLGVGAKPR